MNLFVGFTQFVSYLFYALIVGHIVLQFIPNTLKPTIKMDKRVLLLSLLGIIMCNFMPIVHLVYFFKGTMSIGDATIAVVTQMHQGKLWIMTVTVALLFWLTLLLNGHKYIQTFWGFLLVLIVAYGSHATTEAGTLLQGMFPHGIHFLAVSVWVGVLLHVAWFSKDQKNWHEFLKWFQPLAWACFVLITISGVVLMGFVMESVKDYPSTWLFTYGQMLLLKHVSILPVLAFAFINGYLSKQVKQNPAFQPIRWIQAESVILLFALFFTGIMGNQTPPHIVRSSGDDVPFWLDWFAGDDVTNNTILHFQLTMPSILLCVASFLFMGMIFVSFKKTNVKQAIIMAIAFIGSLYLGILCLFSF